MVSRALINTMLSGAALISVPAHAQTVGSNEPTGQVPAQAGPIAPQADDTGIEDIIVTAQRQSESAQRAGVAISVLQPEALAQVTTVENLSKMAPALQIGSAGGASPLLYIRGVGTFAANPYSDSAVAVNYDGIYLGRPTSTLGLFYDLDRIEVLKGPQGTLYGRNATGGALNVLPAQPKIGVTSASGTLGAGNYGTVNGQLAVNLPVSETLALRIAGTGFRHDGYNTDGTYSENGYGGRAQLLFEPSADLSLRIGGDYFHAGGTGSTGVLLATTNRANGATVPLGFGPNVGAYDPRSIAALNSAFVAVSGTTYGAIPSRPYINNAYYGVNGELNAELGFARLTVAAAWRRADVDNISQPTSFQIQSIETDEQYSLEARLAGKVGNVDWLTGLYYFDETVDSDFLVNNNLVGAVQALAAKNRSYAGFGRLTWHITDTFRATGAARYTKDNKSFDGRADSVTGICTSPTHLCPNIRRLPGDIRNIPVALASIGFIRPPGSPVYIDATGTSNAIYNPAQIVIDDATRPDKVTYRSALEFEPRGGTLFYASYETGYRSGGFSFSTISPVYAPESISAYTIGTKNRFLNNRLQVNLEGFVWKYKDQQVSHQAIGTTGGIEFVTENIGASTNKGFEFEVTAKPLRNTLLTADVQYLDARNDRFVFSELDSSLLAGLPAGTIPSATICPSTSAPATRTYTVNCSGLRALRAPEWTLNLGIQQTVPLANDLALKLEANTHYQSNSIVMFERQPFSILSSYWLSDASITLSGRSDIWSVAAYVSNIEDRRVMNNSFHNTFNGVTSANYGPPRTYGARLSFNF